MYLYFAIKSCGINYIITGRRGHNRKGAVTLKEDYSTLRAAFL